MAKPPQACYNPHPSASCSLALDSYAPLWYVRSRVVRAASNVDTVNIVGSVKLRGWPVPCVTLSSVQLFILISHLVMELITCYSEHVGQAGVTENSYSIQIHFHLLMR